MNLSDLLAQLDQSPNNEITVPDGWAQGRALFGGLVAALLYQGMRKHIPDERPLRSFSISFVGPLAAHVPQRIDSRVLREGRAVTQTEAHAIQDGAVLAAALASFGMARESQLRAPGAPAPEAPRPETLEELPPNSMGPSFAKHFSYHWVLGGLPFSGKDVRDMGGWVRLREPVERLTEAHVLALVDAWPPAVFPMMKERAPASTLTWSIDFIQPLPAMSSENWLLYRAYVDHTADGYGQTSAQIWTESGQLIAVSRQTVAVFA